MYEEQLLIAKGFPLEDALTVCHSMRRSGMLDEFMAEIEKSTRRTVVNPHERKIHINVYG